MPLPLAMPARGQFFPWYLITPSSAHPIWRPQPPGWPEIKETWASQNLLSPFDKLMAGESREARDQTAPLRQIPRNVGFFFAKEGEEVGGCRNWKSIYVMIISVLIRGVFQRIFRTRLLFWIHSLQFLLKFICEKNGSTCFDQRHVKSALLRCRPDADCLAWKLLEILRGGALGTF